MVWYMYVMHNDLFCFLTCLFSDLTAATWGGSTAQSETNSTVSYDPNDTQESLELTHTLGELAPPLSV